METEPIAIFSQWGTPNVSYETWLDSDARILDYCLLQGSRTYEIRINEKSQRSDADVPNEGPSYTHTHRLWVLNESGHFEPTKYVGDGVSDLAYWFVRTVDILEHAHDGDKLLTYGEVCDCIQIDGDKLTDEESEILHHALESLKAMQDR